MNNLITRTITGVLFVAIIICGIAFSGYTFAAVGLLILVLGLLEFYGIATNEWGRANLYYGLFLGIATFSCNYIYARNLMDAFIFLPLLALYMFMFIIELYLNNKRPLVNIAITLLGNFYISLPVSLFNYFVYSSSGSGSHVVYNPGILLGFFILLWVNDTGAYLVGITIGRTRLFERVSPKKSWEGSIGGALFTGIAAYYLSMYFWDLEMIHWFVIGSIIVIFGTYGDLVESLFKRSLDLKDSGNILPGHGGILDRFDAALMASPFVFTYLQLIKL